MGHHRHHTMQFDPQFSPKRGPRAGGPRFARGGFGGPQGGPPPWLADMFGGQGFGGRGSSQWGGFGQWGPGGPGGGPGRGGRRGGPRVRRGDVRAAILDVLAEERDGNEAVNGYQVIQRIAERTHEVWKPSPGSVYPTIQQLEDEGLVVTDETSGRKSLRLTEAGTAYVADHPDEMAAVWAPFSEQESEDAEGVNKGDLKKVIGQTMAAVWQLAATGTTAQMEQAVEVMAETRRKLYTILAEGDPADLEDDTTGDEVTGPHHPGDELR